MYMEALAPHDDEAEEAVIGSLLIDGEAVARVAAGLSTDDFFRQKNRWTWEACLSLFSRNEPINQISVADELSRARRLEEVGGLPFLSHLIATVPTSVYAEHYAQVVRRLSVMRKLIVAGGKIAEIGYRAEGDEADALRDAEALLYAITTRQEVRDRSMAKVVDAYLGRTLARTGRTETVQTGYRDLDKLLGGLYPGQLVLLAARPGVGKSALALNMARRMTGAGKRVLLASLEMGQMEIAERLMAGESDITSSRLRGGYLSEAEEQRVMDAAPVLAGLPLVIDPSASQDTMTLRSRAMRCQMDGGLGLVIVDYLQLMRAHGMRRGSSRYDEVTEISRQLKLLARDSDVPVLAISQLSRGVEQRVDHEPQLSDLRESGALEQDADVVMFLYRADQYLTEEEFARRNPGREYPRGIVDVVLAKHRNGPIGRAQLLFRERTTSFLDLMHGTVR